MNNLNLNFFNNFQYGYPEFANTSPKSDKMKIPLLMSCQINRGNS